MDAAQRRLKRRLKKIVAECQQLINDVRYWNSINPQHPPLDCEPEHVMLSFAVPALAALDRDDWKGAAAVGQ